MKKEGKTRLDGRSCRSLGLLSLLGRLLLLGGGGLLGRCRRLLWRGGLGGRLCDAARLGLGQDRRLVDDGGGGGGLEEGQSLFTADRARYEWLGSRFTFLGAAFFSFLGAAAFFSLGSFLAAASFLGAAAFLVAPGLAAFFSLVSLVSFLAAVSFLGAAAFLGAAGFAAFLASLVPPEGPVHRALGWE
jgi:hypothetical protein